MVILQGKLSLTWKNWDCIVFDSLGGGLCITGGSSGAPEVTTPAGPNTSTAESP